MRPPARTSAAGATGSLFLGLNAFQSVVRILDYISHGQAVVRAYPSVVSVLMNPVMGLGTLAAGLLFLYQVVKREDTTRGVSGPGGKWFKVSGYVIGAATILAVPAWYLFIRTPIAPEFQRIYETRAKALGQPVRSPERSSKCYQGVFDHATVVFWDELMMLYVLPTDSPDARWRAYHESDYETGPEWFNNDEAVIKRLKLPPGCDPPVAGMASRWDRDPQEWSWVGCRRWHYIYYPSAITFQRFEHGLLIGPLHTDKRTEFGEVLGIMDSGGWFTERVVAKAAHSVRATPSTAGPKPPSGR